MAEIKISSQAITDLQQTKAYITEELCNEQAAADTVARITKRIRQLSDFPEIGAPLSSCKFYSEIRATTEYCLTEQTNRHLKRWRFFTGNSDFIDRKRNKPAKRRNSIARKLRCFPKNNLMLFYERCSKGISGKCKLPMS